MKIEEEVDQILKMKQGKNQQTKLKRIKKLKALPIGLSVLLVISVVGMGALLGWLNITSVEADVDDLILLDGVPAENLETSWDIGNVVGGNCYTESHNVSLSDLRQNSYNMTFNVIDSEEDGADIKVLNSAFEEITFLEIAPDETIQIYYRVIFDDYVNMSSFSGSVTIL